MWNHNQISEKPVEKCLKAQYIANKPTKMLEKSNGESF